MTARRRLPDERSGIIRRFEIRGQPAFYVTLSYQPTGEPGEIQLRSTKTGHRERTYLYALMDACSLGLQHGIPLGAFVKQWRGVRSDPCGFTVDERYKTCASELDLIAQWLEDVLGPEVVNGQED